jgi:ABC-type polysaccharide/polyol phosphate export permease
MLPGMTGVASPSQASPSQASPSQASPSLLREPGAISSSDLLLTMIERKIRLRSKRSWIGTIWPIISPVFLFGLYVFVFHSVFKVPQPRYGLYLFIGLLPWTFLAQTLGDAVLSMSNEAVLIRRSAFHHEVLPIASVVSMSLYFLISLAGLLVFQAATGQLDYTLLPVLVIPVLALYLLVGALGIALAFVDIYNRDLRQVLGNLLTVWFFLVPIVYSTHMESSKLKFLRSVDPVSMIVGQFRQVLFYGRITQPSHLGYVLAICGGFFALAIVTARRVSRRLAKDI